MESSYYFFRSPEEQFRISSLTKSKWKSTDRGCQMLVSKDIDQKRNDSSTDDQQMRESKKRARHQAAENNQIWEEPASDFTNLDNHLARIVLESQAASDW